MASKIPDVSIIIVSFNGKAALKDCLKSIFNETSGISFEVIVSDNGSVDGSTDEVEESFPSVKLIKNGANLGFAKANNVAVPYCRGRYILLLNPDTLVLNNAVRAMVEFMDENPGIGACGPKLLNADGSLQFSARNFPSITNQLGESLFLHKLFPGATRFSELIKRPSFYEQTRRVDWMIGAALMIRRETLNDAGPLDESYFMYAEDKEWCLRVWKRGWPVVFYPGAKIVHLHGDSSTNPKLFSMMTRSKVIFFRKNYSPVKAGAMIAIMRMNLGVRIALSRMAGLLGLGEAGRAANKLSVSRAGRDNLNV